MPEIYLNDIAHGRSGDKGDTSNVCVYARKPEYYKIIEREVTPEKLKEYFGDMVKGEITRYDVPTLGGFNFVMKHALGGGATMSLRQPENSCAVSPSGSAADSFRLMISS